MMNVWTGSAWTAVSITNPTLAAISDGTLGQFGHRNKIHNNNFTVNQRAVSGTVTLAAGAYGHDRWKAGAGGCTYTFATVANVTTLTISAGTLMQVIEGANLLSGTHILTWTGTATARVDSGSYGASGLTGTATGGTNQTIEFATGTVSKVQYEPGSVATPFGLRPIWTELALCQRYYEKSYDTGIAPGAISSSGAVYLINETATNTVGNISYAVPKRADPTLTIYNATTGVAASIRSGGINITDVTVPAFNSARGFSTLSASGLTAGLGSFFQYVASSEL
jgi:hypothetical protein